MFQPEDLRDNGLVGLHNIDKILAALARKSRLPLEDSYEDSESEETSEGTSEDQHMRPADADIPEVYKQPQMETVDPSRLKVNAIFHNKSRHKGSLLYFIQIDSLGLKQCVSLSLY